MPTIFGVVHRIISICVTIIYDLLEEEFLMPRGLDEWTEAITRVTQLGARTHRQRQNHQQFFNTKSIDVVDLDEEPIIEIRSLADNNDPVISSITATPSAVDGGGNISVTVVATDTDDDELSYEWSASLGTFADTSLASTTWTSSTSESSDQTVTLSCVVSDNYTGEVTGTVDVTINAQILTVPGRVSQPTVSSAGTASLNVSWSEPSTGNSPITDYDVQYRRTGSSAWISWSHSGTSRTATIASLDPNVTYQIQVRAQNSVGEGPWSLSGTGTTQAAVPGRVSGVTLTGRSRNSISLSWSQPSSNGSSISDYDVQYRRSGNTTWISKSHSGTSRTTTISGLSDGTTYQVRVRAGNSVGEGAWSSTGSYTTISVTVPGKVSTPSTSSITTSSVTVTWSAPSSGGTPITSYNLYNLRGTSGTASAISVSASSRSYTITGLDDDQYYQVSIAARNSEGQGSTSSSSGYTTLMIPLTVPGAPTSVSMSHTGGHTLGTLVTSWQPPTSDGGTPITGYSIRWTWSSTGSLNPGASASGTISASASDRSTSNTISAPQWGNDSVRLNVSIWAINSEGAGSSVSRHVRDA